MCVCVNNRIVAAAAALPPDATVNKLLAIQERKRQIDREEKELAKRKVSEDRKRQRRLNKTDGLSLQDLLIVTAQRSEAEGPSVSIRDESIRRIGFVMFGEVRCPASIDTLFERVVNGRWREGWAAGASDTAVV